MQRQYVANAFENGPFTGNPAAVVPLEEWPSDDVLQAIATQNNLSETAFFVDEGPRIPLRWFTPTDEIDLCGHATLAAAHTIYAELGDDRESLNFQTLSGELVVRQAGAGYSMDFPGVTLEIVGTHESLAAHVREAAGVEAGDVFMGAGRAYLSLESAEQVRALTPDQRKVGSLPRGDLFVSAPGDGEYDIVSRVFAPGVGIPEDPATGAAHCGFTPYWCERLGKETITSHQASARGGYFTCRWRADRGRVDLIGSCRTFSRGEIQV